METYCLQTTWLGSLPTRRYSLLYENHYINCNSWNRYSTRIEELIDSREAISGKRLGFMMKFFTTKCTYRCTILFKVLEPFRWIHFFFCKKFFFSFLTILTRKITPKKIPLRCMLVRHIYTNFFFCWRFSANFCAYGTQNSKNTKSGISH